MKHARINLNDHLELKVIVPKNYSHEDFEKLIEMKEEWILKKITTFKYFDGQSIDLINNQILLFGEIYRYYYNPKVNSIEIIHNTKIIQSKKNLTNSFEQEKCFKKVAKDYIKQRVFSIADDNGIEFNKLFIRDQKTKWGNCSIKGNISINWKLIKAPKFVIDYIICHELLHVKFKNHNQMFWLNLGLMFPEYEKSITWLKKYGKYL